LKAAIIISQIISPIHGNARMPLQLRGMKPSGAWPIRRRYIAVAEQSSGGSVKNSDVAVVEHKTF
jgi:hypothetical protein